MKYGEYEVLPEFTSGGAVRWRVTGNGEYIVALKDGKKWFVKRDIHLRYPARGVPREVFHLQKASVEARERKQERLRKAMEGTDCEKAGIVAEAENFRDEENMFVTVTPFLEGILPDDEPLSGLSPEEFVSLARQAAGALAALHACGVIHGDLKEKNMPVTQVRGKRKPWLIDFDMSYPADEIPQWDGIGGTDGYRSPELLLYASDEGAAPPETITDKTDVFSLAIVFHRWWTGRFPDCDLEEGGVSAAVYLGRSVRLDRKFDVRIGETHGATLISLLSWMLQKDAAARPSAGQVLEVLSDGLEVPEEYHEGEDAKPFDVELWEAHRLIAELYTPDTLRRKGLRALRRVNDGSGSAGLRYEAVYKDGRVSRLSVGELCSEGYARRKKVELCAPWEEDRIAFAAPEVFFEKGYAKVERLEMSFRKRYLLTLTGGRTMDKSGAWMVSEGLASPVVSAVGADTPWPEHGSEYVREALDRGGVLSVSRVEVGGEHRYRLVYREKEGGKHRENDRVPVNNMKLMGYIR